MTPEQWQRAREVLADALELNPEDRPEFLDRSCSSDDSLRREVERLLSASDGARSSFLQSFAFPLECSSIPIGLAQGTKVGEYEVKNLLGSGGMGEVYQARDMRLGREVAIKVLPGFVCHDPDRLRRFEQEARAAAALNHPNILAVFQMGTHEGAPYLVSELLEGNTLRELLVRGPIPVCKAIADAVQIARGLAAAHEKGIIHRDLKPENIFVSKDELVKILDFGLAKLVRAEPDARTLTNVTEPGMVMGTMGYMSPEQVRGQGGDQRSDIFAFGTILYEMLCGERAFQGNSSADIISAILTCDPLRSRQKIPPRLVNLVGRCLEKDPNRRFQSGRDLLLDLEAVSMSPRISASVFARKSAVAIIGVSIIAVVTWRFAAIRHLVSRGADPEVRTIAVLPLTNLSGDANQDYFADGITEELIMQLAKVGSLNVISRTSVMHYKGTTETLPQIGRELNVDAVVEGSVQRSGDRLRITAQLIKAPTDHHMWAQDYERNVHDVLSVEEEVARQIAEEISIKLAPQERQLLTEAHSIDPEAHEAYLKGRYEWDKRTEASLKTSADHFKRAIALDPNHASGYSGLADSYLMLWNNGYLSPEQSVPEARSAALKAVEIDGNSAEAHTSLAYVLAYYDWNWDAAAKEFNRALQLSPSYATAHHWYAWQLLLMKNQGEAIDQIRKARQLDPLSPRINANVGNLLYFSRQYDEAIQELNKALDLNPSDVAVHINLGLAYLQRGDKKRSIAELTNASQLEPQSVATASLAQAYALAGEQERARETLQKLLERAKQSYYSPTEIGFTYAALGEKERAFTWLQKAFKAHDSRLVIHQADPAFDFLRADPRMQDLLHRARLPTLMSSLGNGN